MMAKDNLKYVPIVYLVFFSQYVSEKALLISIFGNFPPVVFTVCHPEWWRASICVDSNMLPTYEHECLNVYAIVFLFPFPLRYNLLIHSVYKHINR